MIQVGTESGDAWEAVEYSDRVSSCGKFACELGVEGVKLELLFDVKIDVLLGRITPQMRLSLGLDMVILWLVTLDLTPVDLISHCLYLLQLSLHHN